MIVHVIAVLLASQVAASAPVRVTARPSVPTIEAGETPAFRVILENTSGAPVHVIDAKQAGGLQRWYFSPVVTRNGHKVELELSIDDPSPPSESDYATVGPHDSYEFYLSQFSAGWQHLKPGIYTVRIRYYFYRHGEPSYVVLSNPFKLQVSAR